MSNTFNKGINKSLKKQAKAIDNNTIKTTLNAKHNELVQKMDDEISKLPQLKEHYLELQKEFDTLSKLSFKELSPQQILRIGDLKDKLQQLETQISQIPRIKLDYLLKNGTIIFKYNELDANRTIDEVSAGQTTGQSASVSNGMRKQVKKISVNDVFIKRKVALSTSLIGNTAKTKADFLKQFLSNVDPNYVYANESNITEDNYCEHCQCLRVLKSSEAKMVCPKCGSEISVIMDNDKPSLKDPPPESRHYEYKRYNHFCDWLAKIQGKESSEVPEEVINTIWIEIKKERITDLASLDEEKIRQYLKKHADKDHDKFFNHTTQILFKINGVPPISLTPEQEREYKMMFLMIQEPYENHCPDTRSNFSSYSYIIYKFSQLLGNKQVMDKMRLLKSKEKLYSLDVIWKKICSDLGGREKGWKFIHSY